MSLLTDLDVSTEHRRCGALEAGVEALSPWPNTLAGCRARPPLQCPLVWMGTFDPGRHPLLHSVAEGAQLVGTDDFPSCMEWADEHEALAPARR